MKMIDGVEYADKEAVEKIYKSFVEEEIVNMSMEIDCYGLYDFWSDLWFYLRKIDRPGDFHRMVILYHRVRFK